MDVATAVMSRAQLVEARRMLVWALRKYARGVRACPKGDASNVLPPRVKCKVPDAKTIISHSLHGGLAESTSTAFVLAPRLWCGSGECVVQH